jgi:hypothetical protein
MYGRRHTDPLHKARGRQRRTNPSRKMEHWKVLLQDRLPAYITWERHLAIVERIGQNRASWDALGAPRKGSALLGGVIQCGQCGGRLTVHYRNQVGRGWYVCHRRAYDPEAPPCPHVPAEVVDGLVSEEVLAVEPASLELSVQASQDVQHERDRLNRLWRQRQERARYEMPPSGSESRPWRQIFLLCEGADDHRGRQGDDHPSSRTARRGDGAQCQGFHERDDSLGRRTCQ